MIIEPTPEQIAMAELNGWDAHEMAISNYRVTRMHEIMRSHTKPELLRQVLAAGVQGAYHPSTWTKQELASTVEDIEWIARERAERAERAEQQAAEQQAEQVEQAVAAVPAPPQQPAYILQLSCGHQARTTRHPMADTHPCIRCSSHRGINAITYPHRERT